ncbi:MAG: LysR substrate-binding domain-containing protein [Pseudomonadota bacterium]
MRYSQLRAFDAVAREGSFSKAADRLGVTQPAVTLQVRALEDDHGISLVRRSTRALGLTEAGQELHLLTRRMFDIEAEIADYLAQSGDLTRGSLLLGADGPHVILKLVAAFQSRYPGLGLRVALGNARATWHDLLDQKVDAAVLANPPEDSRVRVLPLGRQDLMALLPRGHPLAARSKVDLAALLDHPVILREAGSNTRRVIEAELARTGLRLKPALELGSREAVCEAVATGLGLSFIYASEITEDPRTQVVTVIGLEQSSLDTLVYLAGNETRRPLKALVEIAAGLFAPS